MSNPYTPPQAVVSDIDGTQEYQEIRMWSASGRIGRLRYLAYTMTAYVLAGMIVGVIGVIARQSPVVDLALLIYVPALVFCILAAIQRSHDMDWSGWTVLLAIIPFVGLIWIFKRGSEDENRFGAPPPPNTVGVKILGTVLPILFVIGVVAAIAIPAYAEYTRRAAGG